MRILLLNQAFHPDVVSSGQHLTGLALKLAEVGHEVTVVTSRRAYDDPVRSFAKREVWRGIRILRVANTRFGKSSKWRRAADFATFLFSLAGRLCWLPRQDVVLAMTSPPLISLFGAAFAWLRGARFYYWVMDLNPDEALAAGWLRPNSLVAKSLEFCSRLSLKRADKIIVLDRYMSARLLSKRIEAERIEVLAPWSHDTEVCFDPAGRKRFRKANGLDGKFVVMYSGNHSPCHPLDTILAAAEHLAEQTEIAFCFVGGGREWPRVNQFAAERGLPNVRCLPYQPLSELAASLSAADLHLVVMGDPFVGIVHPCKIYNILRVGAPFLYLGPKPSHVSDIIHQANGMLPCAEARHGQVDLVASEILKFKRIADHAVAQQRWPLFIEQFSEQLLVPKLVQILESAAPEHSPTALPEPRVESHILAQPSDRFSRNPHAG